MNFQEFIQTGLPALGAVVATAWFLWNRYQALEARLDAVDRQLIEVRHNIDSNRQAVQANSDRHEYLINDTRNLIEHRTKRFFDELKAVEGRLSLEVRDVKGFLTRTTEFKPRGEGWGDRS